MPLDFGRSFHFDPLDFNGLSFEALDRYRESRLADVADLHRRAASTQVFGSVLTPGMIAEGRARVLSELELRSPGLSNYSPLFLTFLDNPEWVGPTDHALRRVALALRSTPKIYREFLRYVRQQPLGALFELNVYWALDRRFSGAVPQPKLPQSEKRSDIMATVDGVATYFEATVIEEAAHYKRQMQQMLALGKQVGGWFGPGPAHGARRVVAKIAQELAQTANEAPNVLCLSFFDWEPLEEARKWAINDVWNGGPEYGQWQGGAKADLSRVDRLDSIFEFDRKKLLAIHVNPAARPACRLSDERRERLRDAFDATLMIR